MGKKSKKKILIVEDEKVLAEMYRDKLKAADFQVNLAFSSEEGIEILKKKKIDLVLLDILLPKENGITFLKKMKQVKNASKIPVVAFSNYDDSETKREAFKLGAKAYLIKTQFTPKELLEEIKKIFQK